MGLRWTANLDRPNIEDRRGDPPRAREAADAVDGCREVLPMLKVLGRVRPRSLVIAAGVINAALEAGLTKDMVITSGNDGTHMVGSKHYTGEALDIRTKHLTDAERRSLISHVKTRLGVDYQVILEDRGKANEHLHIERDV